MFVKLDAELTPIDPRTEKITGPVAGYIRFKELIELQGLLGLDPLFIEQCSDFSQQNTLGVWEDYSFGVINIVEMENIFKDRDTIGLYISKNLFLAIEIIDKDYSAQKAFEAALQQTIVRERNIPRILNRFFKELIKSHAGVYHRFRKKISELEMRVWEKIEEDSNFESELSNINNELLTLFSYYDQLEDFCQELAENENEIFTEEELTIINLLSKRVERYGANIRILREYSNQLRESYQAQLDLHLNKIMKIFTVVTTIFLPLTLVVGWYGMNFTHMPELSWEYGYITVIILSIAIVVLGLCWFKKKKLI